MPTLILLRHGKTLWNTEGRFTGQTDIPLSPEGEQQAHKAGKKLADFDISLVHTSLLTRAIETAKIALEAINKHHLPLHSFSALNERHYGALQGKTHAETIALHGENQVKLWRRSYDTRPPEGESLADTAARVHKHFEELFFDQIRFSAYNNFYQPTLSPEVNNRGLHLAHLHQVLNFLKNIKLGASLHTC
jgi:2,3-bisphosphoglycerate-dependent phosphoglycerate mutase